MYLGSLLEIRRQSWESGETATARVFRTRNPRGEMYIRTSEICKSSLKLQLNNYEHMLTDKTSFLKPWKASSEEIRRNTYQDTHWAENSSCFYQLKSLLLVFTLEKVRI